MYKVAEWRREEAKAKLPKDWELCTIPQDTGEPVLTEQIDRMGRPIPIHTPQISRQATFIARQDGNPFAGVGSTYEDAIDNLMLEPIWSPCGRID